MEHVYHTYVCAPFHVHCACLFLTEYVADLSRVCPTERVRSRPDHASDGPRLPQIRRVCPGAPVCHTYHGFHVQRQQTAGTAGGTRTAAERHVNQHAQVSTPYARYPLAMRLPKRQPVVRRERSHILM